MSNNCKNPFQPSFLQERDGGNVNVASLGADFWTAFQHPEDRSAIKAMEAIPALSTVLKFVQEQALEKYARAQLIGDAIRLGSKQLPHIYELLADVCRTFRMERVPEFYLKMDRVPNAFTIGEKNPLVTISSGLLEIMPENDVKTVLAHECGHILFKHTRYTIAAKVVLNGVDATLGTMATFATLGGLTALKECIYRWQRMSELSADRMSLLYSGTLSSADAFIRGARAAVACWRIAQSSRRHRRRRVRATVRRFRADVQARRSDGLDCQPDASQQGSSLRSQPVCGAVQVCEGFGVQSCRQTSRHLQMPDLRRQDA